MTTSRDYWRILSFGFDDEVTPFGSGVVRLYFFSRHEVLALMMHDDVRPSWSIQTFHLRVLGPEYDSLRGGEMQDGLVLAPKPG